MTLSWRTRIAALLATVAAIWLGVGIAHQELGWPVVVAGVLGGLTVALVQPLPLETLLLGGVIFGYIVGNRGFAQQSLTPNLPLFPAEAVLVAAGAIIAVRCVTRRVLPVRRDALNAAILLWIAVCSVRIYADVRQFGLLALRDYAMVYYAAFFFLGQQAAAASAASRRFLLGCATVGCVALAAVSPLFDRFPGFFLDRLTARGVPLIYLKGDLAGTFMAVGSVLCFLRFETRRSWLGLVLSLALAAGTLATDNRASMLGLVAASVVLLLARRWRMAAVQAGAAVLAATVILLAAYVRRESWHRTPVYSVYDRVLSLADPFGQRTYTAADADKGDNNLFRMLWWRTVYDDTVATAPVTGLGFGYDLARHFVQEYYPQTDDDFMARSPHNFVLTTFARTGLIGVLPLLLVMALMAVKAVQASRVDLERAAPWLACCVVFVSACFGVVLEGPMGAVVFWTLLGVANAPPAATPAEEVRSQPSEVSSLASDL